MSKLKIIILFICAFAIILPTNISGELSRYQYEIIELAYTNGFLKGMSVDEEVINDLLKDKEKLGDFARKATQEYMEKVVALNLRYKAEIKIGKSKDKKPAKGSNSITF